MSNTATYSAQALSGRAHYFTNEHYPQIEAEDTALTWRAVLQFHGSVAEIQYAQFQVKTRGIEKPCSPRIYATDVVVC